MKYRDGSKYEGQWRTGERHGKGTFYYFGSSSLKYTGEWVRDVKSGQVSSTHFDTSEFMSHEVTL